MPFPESPRVFYRSNPLDEVVCQLRFPPILKIDKDAPADFQDRVRTAFPLYRRAPVQVSLPAGLPAPLVQMISAQSVGPHEFMSPDEVWKISLASDFLALTTARYHDWTEFRSRLDQALTGLRAVYEPAFFQRIGLRYRDRIDRTKLGLEAASWSVLLQPYVLGELTDPAIGPSVIHAVRELIVKLSDSARVRILHGVDDAETENPTYVIDTDFFTEAQTPINGASDVLNGFNRLAGQLFRWCITPRLHEAMGPQPG